MYEFGAGATPVTASDGKQSDQARRGLGGGGGDGGGGTERATKDQRTAINGGRVGWTRRGRGEGEGWLRGFLEGNNGGGRQREEVAWRNEVG